MPSPLNLVVAKNPPKMRVSNAMPKGAAAFARDDPGAQLVVSKIQLWEFDLDKSLSRQCDRAETLALRHCLP